MANALKSEYLRFLLQTNKPQTNFYPFFVVLKHFISFLNINVDAIYLFFVVIKDCWKGDT